MLNEIIPKFRYEITDFPLLEERAIGIPIPELWGRRNKIIPVCIDTGALKYKWQRRASHALPEVRADDVVLIEGTDYEKVLSNPDWKICSTLTVLGTPFLEASTLYYFVISGDYPIDGFNYIQLAANEDGTCPDGNFFTIDAGGVWSLGSGDLCFRVYGKDSLDGEETFRFSCENWVEWDYYALRNVVARTRIAQSFTTPAGEGFYITRILIFGYIIGTLSSTYNIRCAILSSYNPTEVQVGGMSKNTPVLECEGGDAFLAFNLRGVPSNLEIDAEGFENPDTSLMTNVADIISDVHVNLLAGDLSKINAFDLAELKAARTQELCIFLDQGTKYGDFLTKLEVGQLFKFLPNLAGQYTVKYAASGEPAGTPHFRGEHFLEFKCLRKWSAIFQRVKVSYDETKSQEFQIEEEASQIAEWLYKNKETLALETWLKSSSAATELATDYLSMLEYPVRGIDFEVSGGYSFDQFPMLKVKITRTRADNVGGNFSGVLFRIFSIVKNTIKGTTHFICVLDTQTYA